MANPWYLVVETPAGSETWDGPVEMLLGAALANPGSALFVLDQPTVEIPRDSLLALLALLGAPLAD